jgi:transposase
MAKIICKPVSRSIGVDLGKRTSHVCVLVDGEVEREFKVSSTAEAWQKAFEPLERGRLIMEVGGPSPWVSRLLSKMGFDVWVVTPWTLKEIFKKQRRKNDRNDAAALALAGAQSPGLLKRIEHNGEQVQRDRITIVQRDTLVRARTRMIGCLRGVLGSLGIDVPICSSDAINRRVEEHVPQDLRASLAPMLVALATISAQIKQLDDAIEELGERYGATNVVRQIKGVGPLTALAFVLKVEDPRRFSRTRSVGAYFGLAQGQQQSGERDPQMPITKAGDDLMRRLLVQSAHYILGPFGDDSDLKRFGEAICARGGPRAKRRAVVAVARRLAVLMLSLWKSGEVYEPLRINNARPSATDASASTN